MNDPSQVRPVNSTYRALIYNIQFALNSLAQRAKKGEQYGDTNSLESVPVLANNVALFEGLKFIKAECRKIFDQETRDYDRKLLQIIFPFCFFITAAIVVCTVNLISFTQLKYRFLDLFSLVRKQHVEHQIKELQSQLRTFRQQKAGILADFSLNILQYE